MIKFNKLKVLFSIIISLFIINPILAISINTDQGNVISSFNNANFNGYIYDSVFGNDDVYNLTYNGYNFIADKRFEVTAGYSLFIKTDVTSDMLNKTTQVFINYQSDKNTGDFKIITNNITFLTTGSYYIEVEADYEKQPMDIYINLPDNTFTTVSLYLPTGKTISMVADSLLGYTTMLLDINLSLWKLLYYVIIFSITISIIFILVYIGWRLFDWASYSPEIKDLWRKKDRKR